MRQIRYIIIILLLWTPVSADTVVLGLPSVAGTLNPIKGFNLKTTNVTKSESSTKNVGKVRQIKLDLISGDTYQIRVVPYDAGGNEMEPAMDLTIKIKTLNEFTISQ